MFHLPCADGPLLVAERARWIPHGRSGFCFLVSRNVDASVTDAYSDERMTDDAILEPRKLTKEFRGFVAVNGVDLRIRRGSVHALIGPNGAGKTTVFNLLTRFLPATSGSVVYRGDDITSLRPAVVARRGLVRSFQISAVFPKLTVLENVRVALQRSLGTSFHFWRAQRTLDALNGRA